MKNLFKTALLLVLAMPFMANKCEKFSASPKLDNDGLPLATQSGANIFGCLINGEPWIPDGKGDMFFRNYQLNNLNVEDSSFSITVMKQSNTDGLDLLTIGKIDKKNIIIGKYKGNENSLEFSNLSNDKIETLTYNISFTKYDTISKVISGFFDVEFKINETNKIIKMEKGRFDLRINCNRYYLI